MNLPVSVQTIGLLVAPNVFMTVAWSGHQKSLNDKTWYVAVLISWGIALFEYLLQVPAKRIGNSVGFTLTHLPFGGPEPVTG